MLDFTRAMNVAASVGNLAPQPGIYPDYSAPIVRNFEGERQLSMARWGMPSSTHALKNRKTDRGVTNVRNTKSKHWRPWLNIDNRCVVPFPDGVLEVVARGVSQDGPPEMLSATDRH